MALDGNPPRPVDNGMRHIKIKSLAQLVEESEIEIDISQYSDIAVIESIDDNTMIGPDLVANNISLLMHGKTQQKTIRLLVELHSSVLSGYGLSLLACEDVLAGCTVS